MKCEGPGVDKDGIDEPGPSRDTPGEVVTCERYQRPDDTASLGKEGLVRIDRKGRESADWHKEAGQRGNRKAGAPLEGGKGAPG